MLLSDRDIHANLATGEIEITPPVRHEDVRPTGVRLHLAPSLLMPAPREEAVDLAGSENPTFDEVVMGEKGFLLRRGAFVLGGSIEKIRAASNLVCAIDGRSTMARLGLMVHLGSTTFDHIQHNPRAVTFELYNAGAFDLILRPGLALAMLTFLRLSSAIEQPEYGQYSGQQGPAPPDLGYTKGREQ